MIVATDARFRWIPINHESPSDGNSFSMSLEFGAMQRYIIGDAARDETFVQKALLTRRTRFMGYATGIFLSLRQVTAYADLACLSCTVAGHFSHIKTEDRIEGLEGLQPIIGFRFEAPFFTLANRP